jgi:hypothetical protein
MHTNIRNKAASRVSAFPPGLLHQREMGEALLHHESIVAFAVPVMIFSIGTMKQA